MIKWLDEVCNDDVNLVGGKAASLGEMLQNMSRLKINVPTGFVVTTLSFREFINHNNIHKEVKNLIDEIDFENHLSIKRSGLKIRTFTRCFFCRATRNFLKCQRKKSTYRICKKMLCFFVYR